MTRIDRILSEMTPPNYGGADMNLPSKIKRIWIDPDLKSRPHNKPRIKVFGADGKEMSVSVGDDPKVLDGSDFLKTQFSSLKDWIKLNQELIIKFGNKQITKDDLDHPNTGLKKYTKSKDGDKEITVEPYTKTDGTDVDGYTYTRTDRKEAHMTRIDKILRERDSTSTLRFVDAKSLIGRRALTLAGSHMQTGNERLVVLNGDKLYCTIEKVSGYNIAGSWIARFGLEEFSSLQPSLEACKTWFVTGIKGVLWCADTYWVNKYFPVNRISKALGS